MSIGPRLWTSPDLVDTLNLPTFDGHPRRGALREVMVKILTREGHRHATESNAKIQLDSAWGMDNVYGGT